ncbi:hypothetical protein [Acinetobacter johnsonii]|uniref:hypothetical protein n=1 Tax=Acinetobacter johnsonii TaxID=40214 RepID=UPI003AF707DC
MANRVTGRGNPKNTVLKSITSKLQKIDAEMKNQAATIIKVGSKRQGRVKLEVRHKPPN